MLLMAIGDHLKIQLFLFAVYLVVLVSVEKIMFVQKVMEEELVVNVQTIIRKNFINLVQIVKFALKIVQDTSLPLLYLELLFR